MTRRELLRLGAGAAFGVVAVGGGVRFLSPAQASHAPGHGGHGAVNIVDSFTRRGRQVQIGQYSPDHVVMILDGRELSHHVFAKIAGNRFASHLLPFQDYRSARELAQDLVDNDRLLFKL